MLVLNVLLVLPAMTALAMPAVTVTKVQEIVKRAEAVYAPEHTFSFTTTPTGPFLSPVPTKTIALLLPPTITTVPLVPTSPSELILPRENREENVGSVSNTLDKRVPEPYLPEFIDTGACICGLLFSQSTAPNEGRVSEMWRCASDAADTVIDQGGNGKWYNTSLPSEELSGFGKPRNWGENPPYTGQTYVLTFHDGGASYELLNAGNAGALHGLDYECTGVNDTSASTTFYAGQ